ncbi:hypothetical protein TorRG33x02_045840 [Trema orientale]|uniref:Uncharacterized protein n=1 Tax=Trema orientale TaxID=63057 RepID=A0A2P5FNL9_TREOI|nr:hypothetical protein TorRG33x02_045840 [Trema orientale]
MKPNQENDNIMSYVDTRIDSSTIIPESFLPLYDQSLILDKVPKGLGPLIHLRESITNSPIPALPRKCLRDSVNELTQFSIHVGRSSRPSFRQHSWQRFHEIVMVNLKAFFSSKPLLSPVTDDQ